MKQKTDDTGFKGLRNWLGATITRKLLLAFFSIFLFTFLVTALMVQIEVRQAVTDSELENLSKLARAELSGLNSKFEQLSTNLNAWSKLDVMNDLASGDVDKRVENTLANLATSYDLKGELYAFNATGHLVSASDRLHNIDLLPKEWKTQDGLIFVNKHHSPVDGDNIVAMVIPVMASFAPDYRLGTLVLSYHWSEISSTLPQQSLLLYHKDGVDKSGYGVVATKKIHDKSSANVPDHMDSVVLLETSQDMAVPETDLYDLAHAVGRVDIKGDTYLVNSEVEASGLLSGWEVVMLGDLSHISQGVRAVVFKLLLLGLIIMLPLTLIILWLSRRLTDPLRKLTEFVSDIFGTDDLSRRLELNSHDEIGKLSNDFNHMAGRLETGLQAHREVEARLRSTIDNALDAVVQINADGVITGWNDQAAQIFGWTADEAIGCMVQDKIIPPQYREEHLRGMKHYFESGTGLVLNKRIEMTSLHRDGFEFPVELAITSIKVEGKTEFSAFIRDITIKKESEELIWKQANFDKVTGLPNRHMLHDRLDQEIKKAHRSDFQMALLFIDLDRFKEVNDTLGHDMGDMLLTESARRIVNCVRESDTVARLGGDEFTVVLSEIEETRVVERVVQSILKALSEPYRLGEEEVYISGSIGITIYPSDGTEVEDLLKNADQAMYFAKSQGRNQSSYFTPSLQEAAQDRRKLTHDLRIAVETGQFELFFQPIVEMGSRRIVKAEALLRWRHPLRGLVEPSNFIQLAEETGMIKEIGDWVLHRAALLAKSWLDRFNIECQVSINVSPVQFLSDGLSWQKYIDFLQSVGLEGHNIVLEITEGLLLMTTREVTDKLLGFRDAGIQVAIDDFGTGYSSLSYLRKFDIDYLKIDKSFVENLEGNVNNMVLAEAIIVMAHKLELKVIAEGVETELQHRLLAEAGCDLAQGYLYSHPLPQESFEQLLKASIIEPA